MRMHRPEVAIFVPTMCLWAKTTKTLQRPYSPKACRDTSPRNLRVRPWAVALPLLALGRPRIAQVQGIGGFRLSRYPITIGRLPHHQEPRHHRYRRPSELDPEGR